MQLLLQFTKNKSITRLLLNKKINFVPIFKPQLRNFAKLSEKSQPVDAKKTGRDDNKRDNNNPRKNDSSPSKKNNMEKEIKNPKNLISIEYSKKGKKLEENTREKPENNEEEKLSRNFDPSILKKLDEIDAKKKKKKKKEAKKNKKPEWMADKEKQLKRHAFQEKHICQILYEYHQSINDEKTPPLDSFVSKYMREHREIGSTNRNAIVNGVYDMIRWLLLVKYQVARNREKIYRQIYKYGETPSHPKPKEADNPELEKWRERFRVFRKMDIEKMSKDEKITHFVRVSCPLELFDIFRKQFGLEKAIEICQINNEQAPVFGRVNILKITRDELISRFRSLGIGVKKTKKSPYGLVFDKRYPFRELQEFKDGLFEIQDEGSQIVADLVDAKEGQLVLDYCAGAGGKTLAMAHKLKGKGQIYMTDIRDYILVEAKRRLRRAGVQNIQPLELNHPHLKRMRKKMDWVLVDAPCSSTGTIRRNPELKYRITKAWIAKLTNTQREVFHEAIKFMKPTGKIVYATCSILEIENERQMEYFKEKYDLKIEKVYKTLPKSGGMDGFFAVVFSKNKVDEAPPAIVDADGVEVASPNDEVNEKQEELNELDEEVYDEAIDEYDELDEMDEVYDEYELDEGFDEYDELDEIEVEDTH